MRIRQAGLAVVLAGAVSSSPKAVGHDHDDDESIRCARFDGSRLIVGLDDRRAIVDTTTNRFGITGGQGCGGAEGIRLAGSGTYVVTDRSA